MLPGSEDTSAKTGKSQALFQGLHRPDPSAQGWGPLSRALSSGRRWHDDVVPERGHSGLAVSPAVCFLVGRIVDVRCAVSEGWPECPFTVFIIGHTYSPVGAAGTHPGIAY